MHLETLSLKQHGLVVSLVAALWAAGCGGSFSGGGGASGAGAASGAAGASGAGAASGASGSGAGSAGGPVCDVACPEILCLGTMVTLPGDCCPSCEANGGSGGVSGGGAGGIGGGCGVTACPAFACAIGYKSVTLPGSCCPTCVPDGSGGAAGFGGCAAVDCALPDCAPGYKLEQVPDACCPMCVPDTACSQGQQAYVTLRNKLLSQPGAVACKVDKDCALLAGNAYCGDQCSINPVNAAAAQSIDNQLSSFAKDNCSACTPIYPPCAAPASPSCVAGQCIYGAYL